MLLAIMLQAALVQLAPDPGLGARDVVLLLQIGVSEQEIARFAERSGGFQPLDGESFAAVEALGPSQAFLDSLPRVAPDFGELSEIARCSDVFEDGELGLSFVYPSGWSVARTGTGDGGVILRIAPRSAAEPRVFVAPCLFVFVEPRTGIVPDAAAAALQEISRGLVRRFRAAGLRPSQAEPREVPLLGAGRGTLALEAAVDDPVPGVLEMAVGIDPRGRAVGVGFTSGGADRAQTSAAFARLAASVVLR